MSCELCTKVSFNINANIFQYTNDNKVYYTYRHCITNNVVNKFYELSDLSTFVELLCVCSASNKIPKDFEIYYYNKTTNQKVRYIYSYNAGTTSNPIWVTAQNPNVPVPAVTNLKFNIWDCKYDCIDCADFIFTIRDSELERATGNVNSYYNGKYFYEYVNCNGDVTLVNSEGNLLVGECVCIEGKGFTPIETLQLAGIPFEIYYYRNNVKTVVFAVYINGNKTAKQFWSSLYIDYNSDDSKKNIELCQGGFLTSGDSGEAFPIANNDCCDILLNRVEVSNTTGVITQSVEIYDVENGSLLDITDRFPEIPILGNITLNVSEFASTDIAHSKNKIWLYNVYNTYSEIYEFDYVGCLNLTSSTITYSRTISVGFQLGAGLCVAANGNLISSRRSDNNIVELNISTTTAQVVYTFPSLSGYSISGDMVLTTNNKLICSHNADKSFNVTQYDYSTGNVEVVIPLSNRIWAMFIFDNMLYLGYPTGEISTIDLVSPFSVNFVQRLNYPPVLHGASQPQECSNISFNPTPTPTPTMTATPGITPSVTPTSSVTPTPTCPPLGYCSQYKVAIFVTNDANWFEPLQMVLTEPCSIERDDLLRFTTWLTKQEQPSPNPNFPIAWSVTQSRCYLEGQTVDDLIILDSSNQFLLPEIDYIVQTFKELDIVNYPYAICPSIPNPNCVPTPTPTNTPTPTSTPDPCKLSGCSAAMLVLSEGYNNAEFEYIPCGLSATTQTVVLSPTQTKKSICLIDGSLRLLSNPNSATIEYLDSNFWVCGDNPCDISCCDTYVIIVNGQGYTVPTQYVKNPNRGWVVAPTSISIENNLSVKCFDNDCGVISFVLGWYYENESTPRYLSGWDIGNNRPIKTTDPNKEFNLNEFPGITEILPQDCTSGFTINNIQSGTWTVKPLMLENIDYLDSKTFRADCYSGGTGAYSPLICDCLSGLTISATTVTPTPTPTPSITPTVTPTLTVTQTPTTTVTPSITASNTPTPTPGFSGETLTPTPTQTQTPTPTPTNCDECIYYVITVPEDSGGGGVTYEYVSCIGETKGDTLTGSTTASFFLCAEVGSINIISGSASVTPTEFSCGCSNY